MENPARTERPAGLTTWQSCSGGRRQDAPLTTSGDGRPCGTDGSRASRASSDGCKRGASELPLSCCVALRLSSGTSAGSTPGPPGLPIRRSPSRERRRQRLKGRSVSCESSPCLRIVYVVACLPCNEPTASITAAAERGVNDRVPLPRLDSGPQEANPCRGRMERRSPARRRKAGSGGSMTPPDSQFCLRLVAEAPRPGRDRSC